jgi:hypothetical protein
VAQRGTGLLEVDVTFEGQAHLVGKLRVRSSNLLGGVPLLGRSLRGVGEGIQSIQRIERAAGYASRPIFLHVDEVSPI